MKIITIDYAGKCGPDNGAVGMFFDARAFIENAPLSEEDKYLIAQGNAERIFKIKL